MHYLYFQTPETINSFALALGKAFRGDLNGVSSEAAQLNIAGDPGTGKTRFALKIVEGVIGPHAQEVRSLGKPFRAYASPSEENPTVITLQDRVSQTEPCNMPFHLPQMDRGLDIVEHPDSYECFMAKLNVHIRMASAELPLQLLAIQHELKNRVHDAPVSSQVQDFPHKLVSLDTRRSASQNLRNWISSYPGCYTCN